MSYMYKLIPDLLLNHQTQVSFNFTDRCGGGSVRRCCVTVYFCLFVLRFYGPVNKSLLVLERTLLLEYVDTRASCACSNCWVGVLFVCSVFFSLIAYPVFFAVFYGDV